MKPEVYSEPNRLVFELANRTLDNLKPNSVRFEATQLLNSLTGLLVFPVQHFRKYLEETCSREYQTFDDVGWPKLDVIWHNDEIHSIAKVLIHLRNSVAHYRFELNQENGLIQSIHFWDQGRSSSPINWETTIRISKLRLLADNLSHLIRTLALERSIIDRLKLEATQLKGIGSNTPWTKAYKHAFKDLAQLYDVELRFDPTEPAAVPQADDTFPYKVLARVVWVSVASAEKEFRIASQEEFDLRVVVFDARQAPFKKFDEHKRQIEESFKDEKRNRYLLIAQEGWARSGVKAHAWFS